jgi:hypothetical protein
VRVSCEYLRAIRARHLLDVFIFFNIQSNTLFPLQSCFWTHRELDWAKSRRLGRADKAVNELRNSHTTISWFAYTSTMPKRQSARALASIESLRNLRQTKGVVTHLSLEVSMFECCSSQSLTDSTNQSPLSVHQCGEEEAQRFKWIESEKAGRDLGETAIQAWIRRYWITFLRHRWLEHLQGEAFWIELDRGDFGLLLTEFQSSPLLGPILEHLRHGRENLDIIVWALKNQVAMPEVLEILEALDVNSRRLECRFQPWTVKVSA